MRELLREQHANYSFFIKIIVNAMFAHFTARAMLNKNEIIKFCNTAKRCGMMNSINTATVSYIQAQF